MKQPGLVRRLSLPAPLSLAGRLNLARQLGLARQPGFARQLGLVRPPVLVKRLGEAIGFVKQPALVKQRGFRQSIRAACYTVALGSSGRRKPQLCLDSSEQLHLK